MTPETLEVHKALLAVYKKAGDLERWRIRGLLADGSVAALLELVTPLCKGIHDFVIRESLKMFCLNGQFNKKISIDMLAIRFA